MGLLQALITISLLPLSTHAHMEMSNPFPINSQLNPAVPDNLKDYSYTSPLLADGSNYPCKGYQITSPDQNTTATYVAGQSYTMNITGTATHGGGSCQLSLSYDNGDNFYVIKSMIGGCPITTSYNFTIPSYAPPSNTALFAWTWFNEIGNREMYMNCARVGIQSTSTTPVQRYRRAQYKRQNSTSIFNNPPLFVCNVNNGCTTLEQYDVQLPYAGIDVVYGADTYPPQNGSGFVGNPVEPHCNGTLCNHTSLSNSSGHYNNGPYYSVSTVTATVTVPYPNATSTSNSSTATIFETTVVTITDVITITASAGTSTSTLTTTSASVGPVTNIVSSTTSTTPATSTTSSVPSTTLAASTTTTTSSVTSSTTATATMLSGPCTPGAFGCNSLTSFSQCVAGAGGTTTYTYMGPVAAGMECVNGQIIRQNDGPCTPNGQLFCDGEYSFYLCDQGGLINMGPVAPGTICNNGDD